MYISQKVCFRYNGFHFIQMYYISFISLPILLRKLFKIRPNRYSEIKILCKILCVLERSNQKQHPNNTHYRPEH